MRYRRQAFWVAKQVLQLGMGDAFDDWLLEKILLLRKGSVIASGVTRVEQVILWPLVLKKKIIVMLIGNPLMS